MNQQPQQAVMLYDGDCSFCQRWIDRWRVLTKDHVYYEPYQKALAQYPQVTARQCKQAVQLIMPNSKVFSGAQAVFQALALAGRYRWLLWLYYHLSLFGRIAEGIYQWIAHRRGWLSKFSGKPPSCPVE